MADETRKVIVTDIRMPFWSLVIFLVKLALASIPAWFILALLWMAIAMLFGSFGMHGRF
ncbi:MAG: hypothetical protein ACFCUQ_12940 [Kiloniellales bacterium]